MDATSASHSEMRLAVVALIMGQRTKNISRIGPGVHELASPRPRAVALIEAELGVEPEDCVSSDVQIVSVTKPREVGMDRALFASIGLDDRLTGIVSVFALEELDHTHVVAHLVTDEEGGSGSNISVRSEWFRRVVAEMSELDVMACFANTEVITAETTAATTVASKADLWALCEGFLAFLKN